MAVWKENYVCVNVAFKHRTDSAILISFEGEEHWIPRSAISWKSDREVDELTRNDEFELQVADWMAMEKGLRY